MSKRKIVEAHFFDPPEANKKQALSHDLLRSEDTEKYAYAIMKECGGQYIDTEIQLEAIFTILEEANVEAKAMCKDADMWPDNVVSDEYGTDGKDKFEEKFTPTGELSIYMEDGEGDYEKWWTVRKRFQSTSKYGLEVQRRCEAEERTEAELVERERARGEGLVEYV